MRLAITATTSVSSIPQVRAHATHINIGSDKLFDVKLSIDPRGPLPGNNYYVTS